GDFAGAARGRLPSPGEPASPQPHPRSWFHILPESAHANDLAFTQLIDAVATITQRKPPARPPDSRQVGALHRCADPLPHLPPPHPGPRLEAQQLPHAP